MGSKDDGCYNRAALTSLPAHLYRRGTLRRQEAITAICDVRGPPLRADGPSVLAGPPDPLPSPLLQTPEASDGRDPANEAPRLGAEKERGIQHIHTRPRNPKQKGMTFHERAS